MFNLVRQIVNRKIGVTLPCETRFSSIFRAKYLHNASPNPNTKTYSLPPLANSALNAVLEKPCAITNKEIDSPILPFHIEKIEQMYNKIDIVIEEPKQEGASEEKHAIVMIVKRHKKMKKHKRKKLRIKMKFEWAKIRHRRATKKEKAFQVELSSKMKEGDRFSAEQYVEDKLNLLHAEKLSPKWQKVPEWYYKEIMEKKRNVRNEKYAKLARRAALHSVYVKDWNV